MSKGFYFQFPLPIFLCATISVKGITVNPIAQAPNFLPQSIHQQILPAQPLKDTRIQQFLTISAIQVAIFVTWTNCKSLLTPLFLLLLSCDIQFLALHGY